MNHNPHPENGATLSTRPIPQLHTNTAYVFWLLCLLGICGGHRFYSGRIFSGFVYLFTFGIFGIGQLVDLAFIPGMVEKRNIYLRGLYGFPGGASQLPYVTLNVGSLSQLQPQPIPELAAPAPMNPLHQLLKVAQEQGGTLSPAQVALYLELEPEAVQSLLREAQKHGYAEVCNDPETGAVRYRFDL
jgi:TM2 domain-containing membrane protein YozV